MRRQCGKRATPPHQHDVNESFVQGRSEVAKASDALAVTQRLRQCGAKRQRNVLVRVVVVDPSVSLRVHADVEQTVRCQLLRAASQLSSGPLAGSTTSRSTGIS